MRWRREREERLASDGGTRELGEASEERQCAKERWRWSGTRERDGDAMAW
jgi:hypothetical protein